MFPPHFPQYLTCITTFHLDKKINWSYYIRVTNPCNNVRRRTRLPSIYKQGKDWKLVSKKKRKREPEVERRCLPFIDERHLERIGFGFKGAIVGGESRNLGEQRRGRKVRNARLFARSRELSHRSVSILPRVFVERGKKRRGGSERKR